MCRGRVRAARLVRRRDRARDDDRARRRGRDLGRGQAHVRRRHVLHDALLVDDSARDGHLPGEPAGEDRPGAARARPLVRDPAARLPRGAPGRRAEHRLPPVEGRGGDVRRLRLPAPEARGRRPRVGRALRRAERVRPRGGADPARPPRARRPHRGHGRVRADDGARDQEQDLRRRRALPRPAEGAREGLAPVALAADARARPAAVPRAAERRGGTSSSNSLEGAAVASGIAAAAKGIAGLVD